MTGANRYPANVFWSDEDEGFIAVASDLPGCSAFGETQQEALTELQSAIVAWIEAARAVGNPIPEPSQPAVGNIYSGKILVRMPKSLHAHLAQAAKAEAVSLNQHIVVLLTWASAHRSLTTSWAVTSTGSSGGAFSAWSGLVVAPHHGATVFAVADLPSSTVISTKLNFDKAETAYFMPTTIPQRALALGRRTS